ncbi:hypothetical protein R83H12_02622 [Fibrobacteria bacterium R8-3-H12]
MDYKEFYNDKKERYKLFKITIPSDANPGIENYLCLRVPELKGRDRTRSAAMAVQMEVLPCEKVEELKIDKKVHVHEQAHLSAAGGYARGGANYDYVTGPDGNRYANSGHVNLDTGREKTPEATIIKANIIQKAALAPADPSPSDRQIAANAAKMAADAQKEIAEEHKSKLKGSKAETQQDSPDAPQAKVKEATS